MTEGGKGGATGSSSGSDSGLTAMTELGVQEGWIFGVTADEEVAGSEAGDEGSDDGRERGKLTAQTQPNSKRAQHGYVSRRCGTHTRERRPGGSETAELGFGVFHGGGAKKKGCQTRVRLLRASGARCD